MSGFNSFESRISEMLCESNLPVKSFGRKALEFLGIDTGYDKGKGYFPNIKNTIIGNPDIEEDAAEEILVKRLHYLKSINSAQGIQNLIGTNVCFNLRTINDVDQLSPGWHQLPNTSLYTDDKNMLRVAVRQGHYSNRMPNGQFTPRGQQGQQYYHAVPQDKWKFLMQSIENAVIGSAQGGYRGSNTAYSIVKYETLGQRPSRHKLDRLVAISPDILKQFHEKIMTPLFLTRPATMAYLDITPKKLSDYGGLVGKFLKGAASLGASNPRISV